MPGLIVIAPYFAADAKGLLKAAIRIRIPSSSSKTKSSTAAASTCRSATTSCCRSARRASCAKAPTSRIVSYSIGVGLALQAADALAEEGIEAEVIDLRTLRPLDTRNGARSP